MVDFPAPNTRGALVAKSRADLNKLGEGLSALREEDPTFDYHFDPEIGQTIVSGQGELQLQIMAEELKRRFNVEVDLVEPRVSYRATISGRGESKHRHKKQTGGAGQFAEVWMRIESLPAESGVVFTQSLVGSNVDRVFVPSVEKGVQTACTAGPYGGFPVTDVKVDFYDGKQHPVDSKDIAFQIAGKAAFNEAFLMRPAETVGTGDGTAHQGALRCGRLGAGGSIRPARPHHRHGIRGPLRSGRRPGAAGGTLSVFQPVARDHRRPRPSQGALRALRGRAADQEAKIIAEHGRKTEEE